MYVLRWRRTPGISKVEGFPSEKEEMAEAAWRQDQSNVPPAQRKCNYMTLGGPYSLDRCRARSSKERMKEKREERKAREPVRYLGSGQESADNFAYIISSNTHTWLRFPTVRKCGSQRLSSGLFDCTLYRILIWIKSLLHMEL